MRPRLFLTHHAPLATIFILCYAINTVVCAGRNF